jgi:hypothetical protein
VASFLSHYEGETGATGQQMLSDCARYLTIVAQWNSELAPTESIGLYLLRRLLIAPLCIVAGIALKRRRREIASPCDPPVLGSLVKEMSRQFLRACTRTRVCVTAGDNAQPLRVTLPPPDQ